MDGPCYEQPNNHIHIDGLVQERRNSIANALELRLSSTNPSTYLLQAYISLKRITRMLQQEELDDDVVTYDPQLGRSYKIIAKNSFNCSKMYFICLKYFAWSICATQKVIW